jgi:probable HAF family extracellular repeat protein
MKGPAGIAAALLAMLSTRAQAAPSYTVVKLATLGGSAAGASSINEAGWVSGLSSLSGNQVQHAALWMHGAAVDLGALGGPSVNSGVAWPNHAAREVVGISETAIVDPLGESWSCAAFIPTTGHTCVGFVWRNNAMVALPTLGGNNGYAAGANASGQIVGWAETPFRDPTCVAPQVLGFQAALWSADRDMPRALPPLPGDSASAATAINDRGQAVGISGTCDNAVGASSAKHAVLWDGGAPVDIDNLGGVAWNTPAPINQRGQEVAFSDLPGDAPGSPNFHAFSWTSQGGIVDLGTLPGDVISIAFAVNDAGQIVGQSIGGGGSRAFIVQDGVVMDLNALVPAGSPALIYANDINDRGEIVGQAYDAATGDFVAFVAITR